MGICFRTKVFWYISLPVICHASDTLFFLFRRILSPEFVGQALDHLLF